MNMNPVGHLGMVPDATKLHLTEKCYTTQITQPGMAQWIKHWSQMLKILGSDPGGGTFFCISVCQALSFSQSSLRREKIVTDTHLEFISI